MTCKWFFLLALSLSSFLCSFSHSISYVILSFRKQWNSTHSTHTYMRRGFDAYCLWKRKAYLGGKRCCDTIHILRREKKFMIEKADQRQAVTDIQQHAHNHALAHKKPNHKKYTKMGILCRIDDAYTKSASTHTKRKVAKQRLSIGP